MKNKGQNITEFAIVLALVAIVSIGILTVFGNQVQKLLGASEAQYKGYKPFEWGSSNQNKPNTGQNDPPDKTIKNPISKCSGNICTVDFGNFILSGIPEDFNEYVKSAGTSGGTDKLISLLKQMADQLEQNGDTAGAQEYRDLANLGHFIATVQKNVESSVTNCESATSQANCFINKVFSNNSIVAPPEIQNLVPDFSANYALIYTLDHSNPGQMRAYEKTYGNSFIYDTAPAAAFNKKYDSIMANSKYPENMKATTRELMIMINDLSSDLSFQTSGVLKQSENYSNFAYSDGSGFQEFNSKYDPETGQMLVGSYENNTGGEGGNNPKPTSFQLLMAPETGFKTNLDSALICAAGSNKDSGTMCH